MLGSVQNNLSHVAGMLAMQRASGVASHPRIHSTPDSSSSGPAVIVSTENLRSTLAYLDAQTSANQRGIAIADTADAALRQVGDLLTQAKALVVANSNNAGLNADERQANQLQIDSILASVDRLASTSKFNDVALFDGSYKLAASGASLSVAKVSTQALAIAELRSGATNNIVSGNLTAATESIDAAINSIATQRASIGAFSKGTLQTRLNISTSSRLEITSAVSLLNSRDANVEAAMHVREQLLQLSSAHISKLTGTSSGNVLWLVNPMTLRSPHVVSNH